MRGIVTIVFATALGACLEAPHKLNPQQFADVVETLPRDTLGDTELSDADVDPDTDDPDTVPDTDTHEPDTTEVTPEVTEVSETTEVTPEVTDVTETTDTEVTPEVTETTDTTETQDCTTEPVPPECLPTTRRLTLYEPEHADAIGPAQSLVRKDRPDGTSTWARAGEPLEIALSNGSLDDPDLDAHFTFDGNLQSAGAYTLTGPLTEFSQAQANFGMSLRIAPRFVAVVPASGTRSLTIMGWFRFDQAVTSTYDVIGIGHDGPPFAAELALGIANGQWSARIDGATFPFGALVTGWQHVAFTWDEASARAVLYLDGVVAAVATPALDLEGDAFFIGAAFPQGTHQLGPPPNADDVSVYRRALTPSEVRARVQSNQPLGAALIPAQPDYDDLRVYADATPVVREIIGRRPHGDSGAETQGVFGIWRLDAGDLAATAPRPGFAQVVDEITLVPEVGVFNDPDGAIRASTPGKAIIADRRTSTWGSALTIELWARVAATEVGSSCTGASDGATLLVAQDGDASLDEGFALRLCDGKVDFATSGGSVRSVQAIADDRWHHVMVSYSATEHRVVIDGLLSASTVTSSPPADLMRGITLLHRPPLPGEEELPVRMTNAALDEIVLHDSVKSEGYAFNRAWPVLPHVRVLVATAPESAGRFPLPMLELRSGNPAVSAPEINACASLVSSCTGYVAWWRFDGDLYDASTSALHLAIVGTPSWTTGLDGALAIVLDGPQQLTRQQVSTPSVAQWSLEAGVDPIANAAYTIIERPGPGQPPNIALLYALALTDSGRVRHAFNPSGPPSQAVVSDGTIAADGWTSIGGGNDGATSSAFVGTSATSITPAVSPLSGQQTGPIFVARGGRPEQPEAFIGALDAIRIMSRGLTPAERLKYPALAWQPQP